MESGNLKKYFWAGATVALFGVAFGAIAFGLESLHKVKHPNGMIASITVSGDGEVTAKPDIATVAFTVSEVAKTVPEAQKMVENKIAAALKELKAVSVEEKDIKTNSYNVYPQYENPVCNGYICPSYTPKISGYQVTQSVTVKVRKVDQAGEVVGLVGKAEITQISGPDFTVDDIEKIQAEAKELAINEAKEKAKATAKSLGVSLGSITSFSDDQGGYVPMYSARADMAMGSMVKTESVTLPQGESVIKSRVTITYTLK